jgi:hypothetical protein
MAKVILFAGRYSLGLWVDMEVKLRSRVRLRWSAFRHWGSVAPGDRPLESRVNVENERPTVAVNSGQHRFLAFRSKSADWIVAGYYRKKSEKREKSGDREVERAERALTSYEARVGERVYHERK